MATWASSKTPDNVVGSFSHPLIPGPRLELLTTHNTFHSCDTQDDNTKLQRTFVSGLSMFAQFSEAKNVFHICMKVYAFYVLCFLCHSIFFSNKSGACTGILQEKREQPWPSLSLDWLTRCPLKSGPNLPPGLFTRSTSHKEDSAAGTEFNSTYTKHQCMNAASTLYP